MSRRISARMLAAHFAYLDALREGGATNMYGAAPYLMRDQGLDRKSAVRVVSLWMTTFAATAPAARAAIAFSAWQAGERVKIHE